MTTGNVENIIITPLRRIPTEGGDVLHGCKKSDEGFVGFGEVYFSMIAKHKVKAWKRHINMTLNLVAPIGQIGFVFVDVRGIRRVVCIGESNYVRITVPPGIWFGFIGLSQKHSVLMNLADIEHDPQEIERLDWKEIAFDWSTFE